MSDTITRNSLPAVPIVGIELVTGYDVEVEIENILHAQLHGSGYNVTYRPARKRSGTLTLGFATSAAAWAAVDLFKTPYTFTLTADVAETSMTFALRPGQLKPEPEIGAEPWSVNVPFQEL